MYNEEVLKDVANVILAKKMRDTEPYLSETPSLVSKALRFAVDEGIKYKIEINKTGKYQNIDFTGDVDIYKSDEPYVEGLSYIISAASLLDAGIKKLNIEQDVGIEVLSSVMTSLKK